MNLCILIVTRAKGVWGHFIWQRMSIMSVLYVHPSQSERCIAEDNNISCQYLSTWNYPFGQCVVAHSYDVARLWRWCFCYVAVVIVVVVWQYISSNQRFHNCWFEGVLRVSSYRLIIDRLLLSYNIYVCFPNHPLRKCVFEQKCSTNWYFVRVVLIVVGGCKDDKLAIAYVHSSASDATSICYLFYRD